MHFFSYLLDATLTGNQLTTKQLQVQSDSDFVVQSITGNRTGLYSAQVLDTGSGSMWQDKLIQDDNFVGTAQLPNVLLHPQYVRRNSILNVLLLDRSGSGNTVQLIMHGYKEYGQLPSMVYKEKWFQYSTDRQSLSANQQQQYSVRIQSDSDFLCQKIVASSTSTFTVQITDTATNKLWFSSAANSANLVGTAQRPFYMLKPRLIPANANLIVQLTDTSGSSNTVELVLEGYKQSKG